MESLHTLMRMMGIQINNPISVLDQNTSKTFLAQSSSEVKYELFMRATALEDIKNFHDDIHARIKQIELDVKQKKQVSSKCFQTQFPVVGPSCATSLVVGSKTGCF